MGARSSQEERGARDHGTQPVVQPRKNVLLEAPDRGSQALLLLHRLQAPATDHLLAEAALLYELRQLHAIVRAQGYGFVGPDSLVYLPADQVESPYPHVSLRVGIASASQGRW